MTDNKESIDGVINLSLKRIDDNTIIMHSFILFAKVFSFLTLVCFLLSGCNFFNNPFAPSTFDRVRLNTVELNPSLIDFGNIIQDQLSSNSIFLLKFKSGDVNWSSHYTASWISLSNSNGTLSDLQTGLNIMINTTNLQWGTYNDSVVFSFAGGTLPDQTITVNMQVVQQNGVYIHLYGVGGDILGDLAELSISGLPTYPTQIIIYYYTSGFTGNYGLNMNDQSIGNLPPTPERVEDYPDPISPYTKNTWFLRLNPGDINRHLYIQKITVDSWEFLGDDITINGPFAEKVLQNY